MTSTGDERFEAIVSPAFAPFLDETGPDESREAIVVYESPDPPHRPVRGEMREIRKRLMVVNAKSRSQEPVQQKLVAGYRKAASSQLKKPRTLAHRSIGQNQLPIATVEVTPKTLRTLAAQPGVRAILPNQTISLVKPRAVNYSTLARAESKYGMTWGLKKLGIEDVWQTTRGSNINVAVLDTGVYGDHSALHGRVGEFVLIDPLGRRIDTGDSFDAGQHGTHVCGTIAGGKDDDGIAIGVAPEANLLVAGVLVGHATLHTLLEGITWAIEKGADIINMSLGFDYYEPLFALVLDMLVNQYGVLPVVSIGNENHGNSSSPGNVHRAFSVGALEKMPRGKVDVPSFSSGASLVFPDEDPEIVTKPDVVAPGVQVWSCIPPEKRPDGTYEYTYMDGTSMAAPHVSGVAALLMAAHPDTPVSDIIEVLKETAKHPTGNRPDNRWGNGAVRPVEALKALNS